MPYHFGEVGSFLTVTPVIVLLLFVGAYLGLEQGKVLRRTGFHAYLRTTKDTLGHY